MKNESSLSKIYAYSFNDLLFYGIFSTHKPIFEIASFLTKKEVYIGTFLHDSTLIDPPKNWTASDTLDKCSTILRNMLYNLGPTNDKVLLQELIDNFTKVFDQWFKKYGLSRHKKSSLVTVKYVFNEQLNKWLPDVKEYHNV